MPARRGGEWVAVATVRYSHHRHPRAPVPPSRAPVPPSASNARPPPAALSPPHPPAPFTHLPLCRHSLSLLLIQPATVPPHSPPLAANFRRRHHRCRRRRHRLPQRRHSFEPSRVESSRVESSQSSQVESSPHLPPLAAMVRRRHHRFRRRRHCRPRRRPVESRPVPSSPVQSRPVPPSPVQSSRLHRRHRRSSKPLPPPPLTTVALSPAVYRWHAGCALQI